MSRFVRETLTIDGVKTVVYTAGKGEPVMLFHGAGTVDGFEFLEPLTENRRVIVPYHPGFGESGDDPTFTELHDYVLHYLELLDALQLQTFNLIGLSMGGHLAARFAVEHGHRLKKLVLIAPAGMVDPNHPALDILSTPGEQLVPMLVSNFDNLKASLPENPGVDFIADRYRESTTYARLFWEKPFDRKLARYLHRIKLPTLILWGEEDKLIPVQHLEMWRKLIPQAETKVFKGAGHLVQRETPEVVELIGEFLSPIPS
jgi:pimeloyl-ACP methyl ester carboxylesterase